MPAPPPANFSFRRACKRRARFALIRILRIGLRLRATEYASSPAAVILVLAPHQDDEVLGCGGLIACKRLVASPVHVAFITDGSASHRNHPHLSPPAVADLRATEACSALRRLGVERSAIHFLGGPDGRLDRLTPAETAALTAQLARLIETIRPDEIFLPYRYDGSSEHEAAFRLFTTALHLTGLTPRVWEFPVWSWWNPLLLLRTLRRVRRVVRFRFAGFEFLKVAALAEYSSQFAPTAPWPEALLSPDFVSRFTSDEEFFCEL